MEYTKRKFSFERFQNNYLGLAGRASRNSAETISIHLKFICMLGAHSLLLALCGTSIERAWLAQTNWRQIAKTQDKVSISLDQKWNLINEVFIGMRDYQ